MEVLTLQVSYLIPFICFRCKGCFKDFPVIKYTYVACFQVTMWFVFALNGLQCMNSVQLRKFFWSVFSRIRTEYGETLCISPYSV